MDLNKMKIKNTSPYSDDLVKKTVLVASKTLKIPVSGIQFNFRSKRRPGWYKVQQKYYNPKKQQEFDEYYDVRYYSGRYSPAYTTISYGGKKRFCPVTIRVTSAKFLPFREFVRILLHELEHHRQWSNGNLKLREFRANLTESSTDEVLRKIFNR